MKVIAYTALLYGKDYLFYAIRSVIDHVDEYHVIYDQTGHGSHGHCTDWECPDKRWELISEASRAAGPKLRWHDAGPFAYEGQQRDAIFSYAPDADVIFVLDADEIWHPRTFEDQRITAPTNISRNVRVPMKHYWRSFHRAVVHDPAFPVRIIYPKIANGEATLVTGLINHMGYAQRSEIVRFKLETHGHKNEFRRDCDWFNDVFMADRQTDCHPVGSEYWNPEQVDPWQYMPEFMKDHPYANLEVIP